MKPTLCLLSLLTWCVLGSAQATTPGRKFEVASIHQVDMNLIEIIRTGRASVSVDGAMATFKAQSPILLITRAFAVLEDQVVNFPETSRGIFFDIDAKLPEGTTKDLVPEMLQSLLADRFKLAVHRQEETKPVYDLLPGSGERKLQPSDGAGPGRCAMQAGHRLCKAMTMAELVSTINNVAQLARTVASRTALNNPGISNAAADAAADWLVDRPLADKTGIRLPSAN